MGREHGVQGAEASNDQPKAGKDAAKGPGVQALEAALRGSPDVARVAAIIGNHPVERDAMFELLHKTVGNDFVQRLQPELADGEAVSKRMAKARKPDTAKPRAFESKFGRYDVLAGYQHEAGKARYVFDITMTPKSAATGKQIGFIQVATKLDDKGEYNAEEGNHATSTQRNRLSDPKSGYHVDRATADDKTPFYGAEKKDGKTKSNGFAQFGQFGGGNPRMVDAPEARAGHLEFITTATDVLTGAQYDAFKWGFIARGDHEDEVEVEMLDGKRNANEFAERDRAYDIWNHAFDRYDHVTAAFAGPGDINAAEVARNIHDAMSRDPKELIAILKTVKPEHRPRVEAAYRMAYTGRSLREDLQQQQADKKSGW